MLFPGSFNPMHEGHVLLARVAEELRQQPLAFEISVTNVDKPPLAGETVRHRLAQFAWKSPVELTRAPTFVEKSRLFPGTTFVIGADTAERLFGPKYYGDDEARMHMALEEIANSGGSFLVAVRIDAAGRVRALSDIPVPRRYADLFTEIPEHRFRVDISSSEIRARGYARPAVHSGQATSSPRRRTPDSYSSGRAAASFLRICCATARSAGTKPRSRPDPPRPQGHRQNRRAARRVNFRGRLARRKAKVAIAPIAVNY